MTTCFHAIHKGTMTLRQFVQVIEWNGLSVNSLSLTKFLHISNIYKNRFAGISSKEEFRDDLNYIFSEEYE